MLIFEKILSITLLIVSVVVIFLYLNVIYINPDYKGISMKDLSQICILFSFIYLLKSIIKLVFTKRI
jgi:hypothetical protein